MVFEMKRRWITADKVGLVLLGPVCGAGKWDQLRQDPGVQPKISVAWVSLSSAGGQWTTLGCLSRSFWLVDTAKCGKQPNAIDRTCRNNLPSRKQLIHGLLPYSTGTDDATEVAFETCTGRGQEQM